MNAETDSFFPSRAGIVCGLAGLLVLLSAGCASAPKEGNGNPVPEVSPAATNVVSNHSRPVSGAEIPVSEEKPRTAVLQRVAPSFPTKPWTVRYLRDSSRAEIDGVLVYLGRPSQPDRKTGALMPHPSDQRYTVAPLTQGRSQPLTETRPIRICLDPGHGGQDSGTCSADKRTQEKIVTLELAKRVEKLLQKDGFEVMLTRRNASVTQTLPERPFKAYRWRADAFVSIHLNSSEGNAEGIETYVFPASGMESTSYSMRTPSQEAGLKYPGNASDIGNFQLGYSIQRRLLEATGRKDRGVRRARFVVLREATMPAALVECGFMSSPRDLAFLRTETGLDKIALGIYRGIADWAYGTFSPGLPPHKAGEKGKRFPPIGDSVEKTMFVPVPKSDSPAPITIPATFPRWEPPNVPSDPQHDSVRRKALLDAGVNKGASPAPDASIRTGASQKE